MTTNRAAIRHGMIIIDAHGTHVGTVDHVEGERIKMTRIDSLDGVQPIWLFPDGSKKMTFCAMNVAKSCGATNQ